MYSVRIKDSWEDITVGDYIELQDIKEESDVLYILTSLYTLNGISKQDLDDIVSSFAFINDKPSIRKCDFLIVGGKVYDVAASIDKMSASQFIDLQNYLNDFASNLDKIVAICLVPEKGEYNVGYNVMKLADEVRENMCILDALGVYDEVNKTVSLLTKTFSGLFAESDEEEEPEEKKQDDFNKRWGWIYLAENVSKVKGCAIDLIFCLNVLEFLNYCAYIKEKSDFEKSRIEEYKLT